MFLFHWVLTFALIPFWHNFGLKILVSLFTILFFSSKKSCKSHYGNCSSLFYQFACQSLVSLNGNKVSIYLSFFLVNFLSFRALLHRQQFCNFLFGLNYSFNIQLLLLCGNVDVPCPLGQPVAFWQLRYAFTINIDKALCFQKMENEKEQKALESLHGFIRSRTRKLAICRLPKTRSFIVNMVAESREKPWERECRFHSRTFSHREIQLFMIHCSEFA